MVETVVRPIYGWQEVPSSMHSANSVLDGMQEKPDVLRLATFKSGPRCFNDEMSKDIANDIIGGCKQWAEEAGVNKIDFTVGILYGTKRQSMKKDWHILRWIAEKLPTLLPTAILVVPPRKRWNCSFRDGDLTVEVTVRTGIELWNHIAESDLAFLEMACALIRACVVPSDTEPEDYPFTIRDLRSIISLEMVPGEYNVSILQRSQWEWLFFARHFSDSMENR